MIAEQWEKQKDEWTILYGKTQEQMQADAGFPDDVGANIREDRARYEVELARDSVSMSTREFIDKHMGFISGPSDRDGMSWPIKIG